MAVVKQISVEVAYAKPDEQKILKIDVDQGTTIKQAIEVSGVLRRYPEIDLKVNRVGIFGKLRHIGQLVQDKDRIEIYRPLVADPKEVRRKKADAEKQKGIK